MKLINSGLKFFAFSFLLLHICIQAHDTKTFEISDCGDVRIYRKPIGWKEKAITVGSLPVALFFGYVGYATKSREKGLPMYCYATSALAVGIGLYGAHRLHDWHKKMDEPLIVLSQEGIWHEIHGFTNWRDIEGYSTCAVHKGIDKIEEFIEFERRDGTQFQVHLIASFIWDPTIGISKHQFLNFVKRFYNNN